MNKKYIIKKNEEIQHIIHDPNSSKIISKYFVTYVSSNSISYNRYCISVSKKIGKANIRNYYKRIVKDILMKNNFNNSNDYVIILRKNILNVSYDVIKNDLIRAIKGVRL